MHVVTSYGVTGASSRVRVFDWLAHLGLDADVHDYIGSSNLSVDTLARHPVRVVRAEVQLRLLLGRIKNDTVLLSRSASPLSAGRIESALLRRAGRGVYDFDDALMQPESGIIKSVFSRSRTWRRSVTAADVVIAGNSYLAEHASRFNKNVEVIPSCVEPNNYELKNNYELAGPPRAVWLGSPSTEKYLQIVASELLAEHSRSGLRLTVISAGNNPLGALERMVDRVSWSADAQRRVGQGDFGIMPLADSPWERGKCAYKLLQYGAAGLPMIGSSVGENTRALEVMGALSVSSSAEWSDALREIVDSSASAREEVGRRARAGVEENYSFVVWADTWITKVQG